MSYEQHQPPPVVSGPAQPFAEPAPPWVPPPGKRNRLWLVLAGVAVLLVVIAGTVVFTLTLTGDELKVGPTALAAPDLGEVLPDPTPTPAAVVTPGIGDFELTPKITDKECFGSAGCNVSFRIDLVYSGQTLDDDTTWLVTYEVTGIEDGPMIGSLELTGSTFSAQTETVSTTSQKSKVSIKVTDVQKSGSD